MCQWDDRESGVHLTGTGPFVHKDVLIREGHERNPRVELEALFLQEVGKTPVLAGTAPRAHQFHPDEFLRMGCGSGVVRGSQSLYLQVLCTVRWISRVEYHEAIKECA